MDPFKYDKITPTPTVMVTGKAVGPLRWARRIVLILTALAVFSALPVTVIVGVWISAAWAITALAGYFLAIMLLGALGAVIDGTLRL